MHIDETSFGQRYGNLRYEDYFPGLYHLVKLGKTSEHYTQLISVSCNPFIYLDCDLQETIGPMPFIIYREDKRLYQIRKDGSRVQLWAQENFQVKISILLENWENNIR